MCVQARVAHTQLAGYVARRLRDPQASAAASDLGLLAAVLRGYARARHDCAATRDLLTAVSTEVRCAQLGLGLRLGCWAGTRARGTAARPRATC